MSVDLNMPLQDVVDLVESSGYTLDKRPEKLNIVGIRDASVAVPENYSDAIAYFYWDENGNLKGKVAEATTTPSVYYLENIFPGVTASAILKGGQYVDAYSLGLHNKLYEALVQTEPVTVIRDGDRNSILNYFGKTTTGLYGINIHHSTASWASDDKIGKDSAGCQVFRFLPDFDDMIKLAKKSSAKYGNKFTYTLIDKRENLQKNINYALIGAVIIGVTAYVYYLKKNKIV